MMAKLHFESGTMESGKSMELQKVAYNYEKQGKTTLLFKPMIDTRSQELIKSRAFKTGVPAIVIASDEVNTMYNRAKSIQPNCILVDEVQFMSDAQIEELARIVDELDIPVMAYGLLTDANRVMFNGAKRLLELGAVYREIKTVCWYCDRKAVHNMRFNNGVPVFGGEQIMIGAEESYKPVCRKCYNKALKESKSMKIDKTVTKVI